MAEILVRMVEDKERRQISPNLPQYEERVLSRHIKIEVDGEVIHYSTDYTISFIQEEVTVKEFDYNGRRLPL